MKNLSLESLYKKYGDQFDGFDDYFQMLLKDDVNVYFDTSLHPTHRINSKQLDNEQDDIMIVDANGLPDWIDITKEEKDKGKVWVCSSSVRDRFESRQISLSKDTLNSLLIDNKINISNYINGDKLEAEIIFEFNNNTFETPNVEIRELYLVEDELLKYIAKNKNLVRCIFPSERFRTAEIHINEDIHSERYDEHQSEILNTLYMKSLNDISFYLTKKEVLDITPDRGDTKPANIFDNKKICNYLSNVNDGGIHFNFNKKPKKK